MRLEPDDGVALARPVVRYGAPELTEADIARLASDTVTTRITRLTPAVSLHLRYDLAELRAGRVYAYRDIYHLTTRTLRGEVFALLDQHGIDTLPADSSAVASLVRGVPRQGKSAPLDSLVPELPGMQRVMRGALSPPRSPSPRDTVSARCGAP